jgi:hypothetical protein
LSGIHPSGHREFRKGVRQLLNPLRLLHAGSFVRSKVGEGIVASPRIFAQFIRVLLEAVDDTLCSPLVQSTVKVCFRVIFRDWFIWGGQ